jgi:hypothetical protein
VRFACGPLRSSANAGAGAGVGAGVGAGTADACCTNTVIGGLFNCTRATVVLAAVAPIDAGKGDGRVIRYTIANGTAVPAPTATTGSVYTVGNPVPLVGGGGGGCNPCSIAAQVFTAAGVGLEPITRATYNRTQSVEAPSHLSVLTELN